MFGYVCINKGEMKIKDYENYKAVYCSLCKQLGKDYSFLTRFLLNYDCTFFALMIMANEDKCPGFRKGRCKFNPLKACKYCVSSDEPLSKAGALLVAMSYYKLVDNIRDGGFFEKTGCLILKPLFSSWFKKVRKNYPFYAQACEKMYKAIQKALTYGQLTRMKIDNMREEHEEKLIRDAEKVAQEQKAKEKAQSTIKEVKKAMMIDY